MKRKPSRTDLLDSSEFIAQVKLDRLRKMTPEEKVRSMYSQIEFMRSWRKMTADFRHEKRS